jgi:hypothetical protein
MSTADDTHSALQFALARIWKVVNGDGWLEPPPSPPEHLFHFTDAQGMTGIILKKSLWASLATCSSDASEVEYGVELVSRMIETRSVSGDPEFIDSIREFSPVIRNSSFDLTRLQSFVVSFCESADSSAQWLHYGRSGTGVALRFSAARLRAPDWHLVPVVYSKDDQEKFIQGLFSAFDRARSELRPTLRSTEERDEFDRTAELYLIGAIRLYAGRLKHPAFRGEQEWRLVHVGAEGSITGEPATGAKVKYRVSQGRVIPYLELALDPLPITQILLGYSSPIRRTDSGLATLLLQHCSQPLPRVDDSDLRIRS